MMMNPDQRTVRFEEFPTFHMEIQDIVLPECSYADVENFSLLNHNAYFSLLMLNIRSCRKNFLNFSCYFQECISKFSCIILTETWLTKDFENIFTINGFKHYDLFRSQYGGGIRVYVKDVYSVTILSNFTKLTNICEVLTLDIVSDVLKFILPVF